MANKPSDSDESKTMDISPPGKGKINISSRPLATPVVDGQAESNDVKQAEQGSEAAEQETPSPSATRKVIQPISIESSDEAAETVEVKDETSNPEVQPEAAQAPEAQKDDIPEVAKEETATESEPETPDSSPESTDSLPTPKSDPNNPISPASDETGAASVDEMAKAAEQKRLDAEKAKEEALRNQKVEELIKSKQYHVPIGHRVKVGRAKKRLLGLLAVVIILAGTYLALDTKLIGNNLKLPFELIKESETTDTTPTAQQPAETQPEAEEEVEVPVINKAQDEERKSELKNLQQELETFYSSNGNYPTMLSELSPAPTEDDITGASGDAYVYTPSADGGTYILTARLSDGTNYTLPSLN